ncbi:MAG: hypothetical protein QW063_01390 [Candidatus Nanoarchaeia archaeon]
MVKIYWHIALSFAVGLIICLLKPEIGILPIVLFVLADVVLDTDHLIKHRSISKIEKKYLKCKDYPFHKIWIVLLIAGLAFLTPVYWLGIGLLIHFSLDYFENHILFKGKFEWE